MTDKPKPFVGKIDVDCSFVLTYTFAEIDGVADETAAIQLSENYARAHLKAISKHVSEMHIEAFKGRA